LRPGMRATRTALTGPAGRPTVSKKQLGTPRKKKKNKMK
jgi:hypothetical protein